MAQAGKKASGGQPYAAEAAQFLKNLVAGRRVTWRPLRIDRYGRCLASVWVNDGWWKRSSTNVSLELVGAGWAAVYRGPDAEFDGQLSRLEALERNASARRLGMWRQLRDGSYESPQDFKRRRTQNKKQSP